MIKSSQNDKFKLFVLASVSVLADIVWLLYYVPFWMSDYMAKWNAGLHFAVVTCSLANVVLKIIILGVLLTVKSVDLKNGWSKFRSGGD